LTNSLTFKIFPAVGPPNSCRTDWCNRCNPSASSVWRDWGGRPRAERTSVIRWCVGLDEDAAEDVWACRIVGRRDLVIEVDILVCLFQLREIVGGYVWFRSRSEKR